MPIITINNKKVHIQELNKDAKDTVVLIHGMFSNLAIYYFNIAPILAQHFHVVMYDLKSHGKSERTLEGYDLENMSSDLIAMMDYLQIKKAQLEVFVGADNILDEKYSLGNDVNAFGGRYFNAAAPRNYYGGVNVSF